MSKYVLVYLPNKEVGEYNQRLIEEVGPKFGETFMLENPRPVHITLKSPFFMEDTSELENTIAGFVKKQKLANIAVRGFGNFREKVTFLKTDFSIESLKMQKDLLEAVKVFPGIELGEFDLDFKPHLTIAYGNTPETFGKIWNYLQSLPVPSYDMQFDNISLMKKFGNEWKVYRRFELK